LASGKQSNRARDRPFRRLREGKRSHSESARASIEITLVVQLQESSPPTFTTQSPDLLELTVFESRLEDISSILELTNLRRLTIAKSRLSNIEGIEVLKHLTQLLLWGNNITDIGPLAKLTRLRSLGISSTQVTNLQPISGLVQLREINISNTKISDLSPLRRLKNLERIYAGMCPSKISLLWRARRQRGLPPLPEPESEPTADLEKELKQDPLGARFEQAGDHLIIAPSGDESDQLAASDPTTQQIHETVKRRAHELASQTFRLVAATELGSVRTIGRHYHRAPC
jgi:hypothetical protein